MRPPWPRHGGGGGKRAAVNLQEASKQGRAYAEQLDGVPFVFLANGDEVLFWDYENEAYPRPVSTFFSQPDFERRIGGRKVRLDPLTVPVDKRIAERYYQMDCIDTLCREMNAGRLDGFTLDHFVMPPFSNIGGLQRAIQVFGSEEQLAATLASLSHALFSQEKTAPRLDCHKYMID